MLDGTAVAGWRHVGYPTECCIFRMRFFFCLVWCAKGDLDRSWTPQEERLYTVRKSLTASPLTVMVCILPSAHFFSFPQGDCSKAKKELGWVPEITFQELVKDMMKSDIANVDAGNEHA